MGRRAFTMIELVITVALTGIVVGAVAGIFGFASIRLSDSYTQSSLYDQVSGVASRIEANVRNAHSCAVVDTGSTLICAMPVNGFDKDGDGNYDDYYPDSVDANGAGLYAVGRYSWYFNAGTNGNYNSGQTGCLFMVNSTSATEPKKSENDAGFTSYQNGKLRYPLVTGCVFYVNSAAKTVTYTVTGSSRIGSASTETSVAGGSRIITLTRTVQWRN